MNQTAIRACDTRKAVLTYRVVRGGCICNQRPADGVLSKNARRALEKRQHPAHRAQKEAADTGHLRHYSNYSQKRKDNPTPAPIEWGGHYAVVQVRRDRNGLITCPSPCLHRQYALVGTCECTRCDRELKVLEHNPVFNW